jgi:peptidoglycan DL-endopeptidase LytF
MQPIERYGLVALLFLVVTVVAVVLWDKKSDKDKAKQVQPQPGPALVQPQPGAPELGGAPYLADNGAVATPETSVPSVPAPIAAPELAPELPAQPVGAALPLNATAATYKVQRGDTLSSIAKLKLGSAGRYPEILALNPGLDPKRLRVGQSLALPQGAAARSTPVAAPKLEIGNGAAAPRSGATYTVKRGESLWAIAESQLGDGDRYTEIAALNPQIDPNRLVVGARLRLPATSTRPAAAGGARQPAVAANTGRRGGVL